MKRLSALLTLLLLTVQAHCQQLPASRHKDAYSDGGYVSASAYDYSAITRQVIGNAKSQYDQARAIYLWLCENIAYDASGKVRTADECWNARKGVCQGYCELFYRMAETIGIKTKLVYGSCKNQANPQQSEKHVWLVIKTERGEILADPTWGAGCFVNGKFQHLPMPQLWFDTDPHWFAFTHMPQQKKHQHLAAPVSDEDFAHLPYITPLAAHVGLTPAAAKAKTLTQGKTLVKIPPMSADQLQKVRLVKVPQEYRLTVGSSYTFQIEKLKDGCTLSIQNEAGAYHEESWTRQGNTYTLNLSPRWKGKLSVVVTTENPLFTTRKAVLEYVVE